MSEITITLRQIESSEYLSDSNWEKLLISKGKTKADDELFPLSDVLDSNGLNYTIRCFRALPEHSLMLSKFALWCAKKAKPAIKDERAIKCLETTEKFHKGNATSEELKKAMRDAHFAAEEVSGGAVYASLAARDAAHAAHAPDNVNNAAWNSAYNARTAICAAVANSAYDLVCGVVRDSAYTIVGGYGNTCNIANAAANAAYDAAVAAAFASQEAKLKQILNTGEWVD